MSGDVQPRKRKDKRRKKEGSSLGSIHEPISSHKFKRSESDDRKIFDVPDQGEKIHVQNDHGIGGNIWVKIIFFCLFGLLVGAVGLIYIKSLGSTDVDLPTIEESRFAEYFTGWLDDSTDDHEHEAVDSSLDQDVFEHDEHDEHDEHGDHDDFDDHELEDHDDEEHENEDQPSVQDSIYKLFGLQSDGLSEAEDSDKVDEVIENIESGIVQDVEEDEEGSEEKDEDNEDDEDDEDDEEDRDNENDQVEEEEEKDKIKEEDNSEEEDNDSGVDLDDQNNSENEKDDEDEDEDDLSQVDEEDEEKYSVHEVDKIRGVDGEDEDNNEDVEKKLTVNEEFDDDEDDEKNDDDIDVSDNREEEEEEGKNEPEQEDEEEKNFKVDDDDLGYEEIDVSEEDLEENVDKLKTGHSVEEIKEESTKKSGEEKRELESTQIESGNNENEEELETDFGGVAVKLGVGIALIIVAHLVLVKKWKSMTPPSDEIVSAEETPSEKKKTENLHSEVEPVISRRQTLVPENVCFNTSYEEEEEEEEEMDDEEEDEENIEDEEYSEEECKDEFEPSGNRETFKKPSWNIKSGINEGDEKMDNEEFEVENEEYAEEDVEEVEDEQEEEEEEEEDYEDDDDEEFDEENNFVKQKPATDDKERQEEVKEITPAPPPRTKSRKGAQEIDEDFTTPSEEPTEVKETGQDGPKADDETNNSGPEKLSTSEKKVGNEDEWAFRRELEFADEQFENNPKVAVEEYSKIISKKPTMIRALIGRARALDHWAEKEKSNAYLKQAINAYKTLLLNHSHLLDNETYVKLAERCIERMRFAGLLVSAVDIHKALILKYPNIPKYRNTLAVTYLMLNKISQARALLNETLTLWPENGVALVHYGFILKTSDNNMEEGAKKLMAGIQTKQEGVIDGMFFFHLGDALNRLGREQEAMKWYELGVKEGLFLSKYQRSLYNVNRLKGQPWWTKEETTYQDFFKKLEDNWREIRKEGLELLNSKGVNLFKEEAENLKDTGDWKQLDLYFRGRKQANCNKAPITCSLVSSFKPASTCTRGQIKFSVMFPNTHVWPHCGPTNCRLRSHLGLVVPRKTYIRVAEETRSWEEGKFIIFDDSFEHEVWHNGTGLRLVLIVDVWHPELTNHERRYLSPI